MKERIIRIEILDSDKDGNEYHFKAKFIKLYITAVICILFAGILALLILGFPSLLGLEFVYDQFYIQVIISPVIIGLSIPIVVFWIIPKEKRYEIR